MNKEFLDDLYEVGSNKSLGYLPIDTITNLCGTSVDEIISYADSKWLKYLLLDKCDCDIYSGAIYVYDEGMLLTLLHKYSIALENAGVPIDNCIEYIKYIANNTVFFDKYPIAYMAIGKTFNDIRFR